MDSQPTGNCHLIIPNEEGRGALYHSNMQFAASTHVYDYQISCVVTVGANLNVNFRSDIERIRFDLLDAENANIKKHFSKANQFIESKMAEGQNVLVHCSAGVSRSASIVIAYLMRKNDLQFQQAYKYLQSIRQVIQPNQGFVQQLQEYEAELNQEKQNQKKMSMEVTETTEHKEASEFIAEHLVTIEAI